MADRTGIEWTRGDDGSPGATWNVFVGCSAVSPGCTHCYAEGQAPRQRGNPAYEGVEEGGKWTGRVNFVEERLDQPLRWRRPRRIFVNSVSDVFHENAEDAAIAQVYAVMGLAHWHTFQVLTKRPQRMARLLNDPLFVASVRSYADQLTEAHGLPRMSIEWPIPNVWMGTSVESDQYVFRADYLRRTPAAARFISAEPLIGPILQTGRLVECIDWLIIGGESGRGARPMHPAWARTLIAAGELHGAAVFFKQWGAWEPVRPVYGEEIECDPLDAYDAHEVVALEASGSIAMRLAPGEMPAGSQPHPPNDPWWLARTGKHEAGRELDGRTWDEYPRAKVSR